MRASIVIASHNEGDMLWKTVAACRTTCQALDYEIVVADDASTDQSVVDLVQRFPDVSVISQNARKGVSPTKDLAAEHARGEVLVFLDAHCKPEPGAMEQLVADVEATGGQAVFMPTIVRLDPEIWENDAKYAGHRYGINLRELTWGWIEEDSMRSKASSGSRQASWAAVWRFPGACTRNCGDLIEKCTCGEWKIRILGSSRG